MKNFVVQCYMTSKNLDESCFAYTAFIPEKFAVVGKKIKIDGRDGIWTVEKVFERKSVDLQILIVKITRNIEILAMYNQQL